MEHAGPAAEGVLYLAWIALLGNSCRIVIRAEDVAYAENLANGREHLPRTPLKDVFIVPRYYLALFRAAKFSDLRGGWLGMGEQQWFYHNADEWNTLAQRLKVSFTSLGSHFCAIVAELSSERRMWLTPRIWQTAESIYLAPRSRMFLSYLATTSHFSALLNSAICAGVGWAWASSNGFTITPTNGTRWPSGSS